MTTTEFFEALSNGQKHFKGLDFEYPEGFQKKDFSGCIFENCFLYVDFEGSNFSNAQFLGCNLKEIRLVNCDLTNAVMKNCLVEAAEFNGAIVDEFEFSENYYYGLVLSQPDFANLLNKE